MHSSRIGALQLVLVLRVRSDVASCGAGTTSTCGRRVRALQGNCGVNHKAHVVHIYRYAANLGKKFLVNAKRKSAFIELFINIGRPIQGQGKTRTASAAWSEVNTDVPTFFVRKIRFKLFTGAFTKLEHEKSSTVF